MEDLVWEVAADWVIDFVLWMVAVVISAQMQCLIVCVRIRWTDSFAKFLCVEQTQRWSG